MLGVRDVPRYLFYSALAAPENIISANAGRKIRLGYFPIVLFDYTIILVLKYFSRNSLGLHPLCLRNRRLKLLSVLKPQS